MTNWTTAKLDDCLDALIDYRGKSPRKSSTGIPVLSAKVVKTSGLLRPIEQTISPDHYETWMTRGFPKPDDVVMTTEAPLGEVIQLDAETSKFALGQRVVCMRGKTNVLDSTFLRYLLISPRQQANLAASSTGTTVLGISQKALRKLEISFPNINEQIAIGNLLRGLDDKIELNRKTSETLEEMARALFRDWFVDFGPTRRQMEGATDPFCIMGAAFPAEKAATLSSLFPDTLGENGLPEGWEATTLGNVVEPRKGRSITKKTVVPGDVPVVAGGLNPAYYHSTSNVAGPVITASASGANAGFVRLYHQDIWASDCSFIGREQTGHIFTIYALLSSRQDEIYKMQHGAAQPHVYPSDLKRLAIVDAPAPLWQALEALLEPMFELVSNNERENQILAEMRDLLLPRLMSGEVRVGKEEASS